MINVIILNYSCVRYPNCYYRYPISYLWHSGVTMMILVGMMSIAWILAFSGGIGGFDILGSTDEEAVDQATLMRVTTPFMAKKEMTQSATAEGTTFYMVKRGGTF